MKNHRNDNQGEFPEFFRIHPIHDFRDFPENGLFDNDHFHKKIKNHIQDEFEKKPGIHPSYHFCDFPSKIKKNGLKNESFEISRN